ncbi:MAG: DUF4153 domain-containing protein [Treponemataceae bacterium]|nr:DUF4153 domain-containing protein [Treponemataceae bacterium]
MEEKKDNKIKTAAKIKQTIRQMLISLKEQKVVLIFSILSCIFMSLDIFKVDDNFTIDYAGIFLKLGLAFLMGSLFSIPAAYLTQKLNALKKYLIQVGTALAASVLGYFSSKGFGNKVFDDLYYWGIFFAAVLAIIFIFIPKNNQKTYFAGIFKYFLFSFLMTFVLFCAGSVLLITFQHLIYDFDPIGSGRIYETYAAICYIIFGINIYVYYLFYRREEESSGKAFKVIFLYILLPVFFLLIAVLYGYLLKALILLEFPKGQVNWFVSFASAIYFVFYFILREYDDLPAVKIFYRFGALAFIPLVCVQIPAYFVRLHAYGFTGWRYSSLMFIIFTLIMFTLTFIKKGKFAKYSILVLAFIILFTSVSPFNLIKMAHKSQMARMMKVLNKYELYDMENKTLAQFDKDELFKTIETDDWDSLYSSYEYLRGTSKLPMPEWALDEEKHRCYFTELFPVKRDEDKDEKFINGSLSGSTYYEIDISAFNKMKEFSIYRENERASINIDGVEYDLTDFLLDNSESREKNGLIYWELDAHYVLGIKRGYFKWIKEDKVFDHYNLEGYIFWR